MQGGRAQITRICTITGNMGALKSATQIGGSRATVATSDCSPDVTALLESERPYRRFGALTETLAGGTGERADYLLRHNLSDLCRECPESSGRNFLDLVVKPRLPS